MTTLISQQPILASGSIAPRFGDTRPQYQLDAKTVIAAFEKQGLNITEANVDAIADKLQEAVHSAKEHPTHNTVLMMKALPIATALGLNQKMVPGVVDKITNAVKELATKAQVGNNATPEVNLAWNEYFDKTVGLTSDPTFRKLTAAMGFSPVKISWEDIGRTQGSVWGHRISDVGLWVRKNEADPASAKLALSVRRDNNFRDKILMVPSEKIKVHSKEGGRVSEVSLPERLKALGLESTGNDDNVIVSNQFAVLPVPSKAMKGISKEGKPPRSAFAFSIQPYGSKNLVITDVMDSGSSQAVVSGRSHQLLYAKVGDNRAPFTASRAEDRKDLAKMEATLKAQGMDVDVQRYYLIQVPLKNDAPVTAANMGEPPRETSGYYNYGALESLGGFLGGGYATKGGYDGGGMKSFSLGATRGASMPRAAAAGLGKVAIGTGEVEGEYSEGTGYRGQRADEPVRVTVVYAVTPKGEVSQKDMENMSAQFKKWDEQAIWGGSFVVPN